jgi:sialate O-acetylesterase
LCTISPAALLSMSSAALLGVLLFFACCCPSGARLSLPSVFSDNCILQTNAEYGARSSVYGWCEPGELVMVQVAKGNYSTACNGDSFFEVTLNPIPEGSAFDITVSGSVSTNVLTAKNCQGGDVYLCGGQSNMCFSAESAFNASALVNVSHPNIRLFSVVMEGAATPQRDFMPPNGTTQCTWNHDVVKGTGYPCNQWSLATPETQGKFSAVCLFTALQIASRHTSDRPIGLIYSAFGGTSINLWAPPQVYVDAQCPGARATSGGGALWNAMINPLVRFSLRSVLWFQGEADQGEEAAQEGYYSCRFAALINYWRASWGMGDFSFNFVQLGPVVGAPASGTGDLRYAQSTVLPRPGGAVDSTGMAAAYDLGDASSPFDSVHFRNKVEVGRRLAAAVLHSAFALQNTSLLPPRVVRTVAGAGGAVVVAVETLDGGGIGEVDGGQCTACCRGGGSVAMFQVATARQGPWVAAAAVAYARGAQLSNITITPASPGAYTLLRFAHDPYPQCAIIGAANGLPLPAFLASISPPPAAAAPAPAPGGGALPLPGASAAAAPPRRPLSLVWRGRTFTWREADPKPPLGLNTWNAFHCNVDELLVLAVAKAFVTLGLRDLGWLYVNIDDGWQVRRPCVCPYTVARSTPHKHLTPPPPPNTLPFAHLAGCTKCQWLYN